MKFRVRLGEGGVLNCAYGYLLPLNQSEACSRYSEVNVFAKYTLDTGFVVVYLMSIVGDLI